MLFSRLKYLLAVLAALTFQSITMPAQSALPQLETDRRIQRGLLGCGATYYMVFDPVQKGYAHVALVQKADSLTPAKRRDLSPDFLSRMGVAPGPEGYLTEKDGSTIYHFNQLRFYRAEVLDSVLLYTFSKMAASRAPQALIVSGDIDAVELKKKMDIFSMLVSRLPGDMDAGPSLWESSPAPVIRLTQEGPALVKAGYSGARVPAEYMNTAQALVTDLFSLEFKLLLEHRLDRQFRLSGIPYGSISFYARRSADSAGDEHYDVEVTVAPENLDAALEIMARTIAELDSQGPAVEEFTECKQVLLPYMQRKAFTTPPALDYVERCIANFLYGAHLAPYTEPLRFFARKRVSDSTETRLFADYADALLTQLDNLSLTVGPMHDSDTTDTEGEVLFRYNLNYLLGSLAPSGQDYRWHASDTAGLEVTAPKIRIKTEKAEAVSGGTLWTFTNGMRVIYKQVKGSGRFSYALQLGGGLSQISNLKEGEGAYIAPLLFVGEVAGIPGPAFRDMLLSNGISMEAQTALNNLIISGDAPSGKLSLVLKSLLGLANARHLRADAFEYFRQCELVRGADDPLLASLTPGYKYTPLGKPSALSADTPKKAQKYFDDRFSRMNDGVLILCGDLSPEAAKRHLLRYLGAFRVLRGTAARKVVENAFPERYADPRRQPSGRPCGPGCRISRNRGKFLCQPDSAGSRQTLSGASSVPAGLCAGGPAQLPGAAPGAFPHGHPLHLRRGGSRRQRPYGREGRPPRSGPDAARPDGPPGLESHAAGRCSRLAGGSGRFCGFAAGALRPEQRRAHRLQSRHRGHHRPANPVLPLCPHRGRTHRSFRP